MTTTAKIEQVNGQSKEAKMLLKKRETSGTEKLENAILELEKRVQKVEKLNEAKKDLTGFKLENDGLNSIIMLRDAAGRQFKTSHNLVMTTVLDTLQQVMDERIAEVVEQINFGLQERGAVATFLFGSL